MATFGAQGFGAEPEESVGLMGRASELAKGLKHPMPALFHLLFKVRAEPESPAAAAAQVAPPAARAQTLAILVYMFGSWFSSSFVNVFVVCVLLLAFDFWTVKNVSGRLMVGLRWHSEVQDDGTTQWRFEAQEARPARPSPPALLAALWQQCRLSAPSRGRRRDSRRRRARACCSCTPGRRTCRARRSTSASSGSACSRRRSYGSSSASACSLGSNSTGCCSCAPHLP